MDNERRYSAAHHPSIFALVRPATKTAFLLIKDSRLFFLSASFFLTATMMIRVSSPKACEIRGISHKQKRKDQKMKKHSKHSGFFLVSLRDVVSIAKTEYAIRASRRKLKVGISRTAEIKTL